MQLKCENTETERKIFETDRSIKLGFHFTEGVKSQLCEPHQNEKEHENFSPNATFEFTIDQL